MRQQRKLVLRLERLTELTPDELRVFGGQETTTLFTAVTVETTDLVDRVISQVQRCDTAIPCFYTLPYTGCYCG